MSTTARDTAPEKEDALGVLADALSEAPLLRYMLAMCIVMEFGFTKELLSSLVDKPFFAQVNVGVEPEKISDMFALLEKNNAWDHRGITGMLQVHHVANYALWPESISAPSPAMLAYWGEARKSQDAKGNKNSPVVVISVVNGMNPAVLIFLPIMDYVVKDACGPRPEFPTKAKAPFYPRLPFFAPEMPGDIANFLNNINEQIRADTKNELKLRTPMHACDKKMIVDAQNSVPGHFLDAMRSKMFREPIYDTKPKKHLDPASPLGQAMEKIRTNPNLTNLEKLLLASKLLPDTP